jgi:hypothetical protein
VVKYEEWLKSTEFVIKRKYKVENIVIKDDGMRIDFANNFHYGINTYVLKGLWQTDNGFDELCNDIEKEYLSQIRRKL